mgnify:FL=1
MSARLAAFALVAAVAGAGGCTHNPGYFPYWLPPGPVQQTHAKPRLGYFRDFDPKAHKLDVKPGGLANAPLGAQLVLAWTVYAPAAVL